MTHLLMQENYILDCEDFYYSERNNVYSFYDCAEDDSVHLNQSEFIEEIACSLLGDDETIVTQYYRDLAVNILANSTRSGRAAFLHGMMP